MELYANSRFSQNPSVNVQRSKIGMSHSFKFTGSSGKLIPIYCKEILPGDTLSLDVSSVVRMSTPIFPVMDNCFLDTYYFFVPNRLVWDKWEEFCGENKDSYWTQPVEYEIPQLQFPIKQEKPSEEWADPNVPEYYEGFENFSIADYFGLPTKVSNVGTKVKSVNALPFRALGLIYNEWFRDQNTMMPYFVPTDSVERIGYNKAMGSAYLNTDPTSCIAGGELPSVSRYFDYFSSCLPQPQKGDPVTVSLASGLLPVITTNTDLGIDVQNSPFMTFGDNYGNENNYNKPLYIYQYAPGREAYLAVDDNTRAFEPDSVVPDALIPNNLAVDIDRVPVISINELRNAFQIQKLLEKDALGGSRYREQIYTHFGIVSPDARMQIPEYLAGKRTPINVDSVVQTSATSSTPQGNVSAFSHTSDVASMFTKSFTEHGYVIGVACIRCHRSYQQGIHQMWSRKRRFDFYYPVLANIGNQPVMTKEIYFDGSDNDDVFGYQEAWASYRYSPSQVAGSFRSNADGSLDSWHYADYYDSQPYLNAEWMKESPVNIARTLAVQEQYDDQFLFDFYFKSNMVRPMPLYSIPGMIDHF